MQIKREDSHGKSELLPPKTFEEMPEEAYHEILFKAGKGFRDTSDRKLLDVYMKSRTLTGHFFHRKQQNCETCHNMESNIS